ncbi:MAG: cation diffusion facilitator family transporter [Bacteroidales bacterium]|nr:cation diffusion facilitator family transporter [Bacteroidales bacterium]
MDDHNISRTKEPSKRNILISLVLNFVITIAEIVGGILSNSLALLSDALHNLSDTFSIFISYMAMIVGKKKSTSKNTFGYKRIEILAALLNGIILIVISIYLFYEAYQRLIDPQPVQGKTMMIVAIIGLLANLISVVLLHSGSLKNLNIKAAYLHLLGDTLSSVGVIGASILISLFDVYWVDPLLTFLIGIFIVRATYGVLKETVEILMQASPENLDIKEIKKFLETHHPKVENIHHIHVWRLSDDQTHFECHADLCNNYSMEEADKIRKDLESILKKEFNIHHVTIQMEYHTCRDKRPIV